MVILDPKHEKEDSAIDAEAAASAAETASAGETAAVSDETAPTAEGTTETTATKDAADAAQRKRRWRDFFAKRTTQVAAGVAAIITAALGIYLGNVLTGVASPPASLTPAFTSIGNPGHPPGRQDVSTMAPGKRFYAVANFYDFPSCGRPCWLPLYQQPTEKSADVTENWPCEYYQQDQASNAPTCVNPPAGRTLAETANPSNPNSGDKVLVVCQAYGETVSNEAGQSSDIWDMVAVPRSRISSDSITLGRLSQIPGMPGFYQTYGPDIWLGDTGWHRISCP